ncbi:ISAs1 family transposase [Tychonema sp. LEGE 06208]|uniref:ISAs1 family transposase n=1 Tax=Tychonema sp. LEGE 06208 TaxID=1828663 RepID=UPI00187F559C|nr:ISAs1 family transposase [Tychonema sp. LEGE 06208]MBE9165972.1 ISAs1 family transposase [Tychonema sp. LEGE 06208]
MSSLAIVAAFSGLPDARRGAGRRHDQALCIALFTLAISAGCRGFLSISDWLKGYRRELLELFSPAKSRLPSYSTIRRVLLNIDYEAYSHCLADFFVIEPLAGETIAMDGKVLRGSYNLDTPASTTESHPAIQLVTVYVVERGLILPIQPVDCKSNEIKALPPVLKALAERGVVFAFDALNTQKKLVSKSSLQKIII